MNRKLIILAILLALGLSACATASSPEAPDQTGGLVVSDGTTKKAYTQSDLAALPSTQAAFKDVPYKGVTMAVLLQDAGFDPRQVKAVKALASDGFAVNYDPSQFLRDDFIVAYALPDGKMAAEDGAFRIVLPGAEGKLNVRMLVELQVVK